MACSPGSGAAATADFGDWRVPAHRIAFAAPRFTALYRLWSQEGDAVLAEVGSLNRPRRGPVVGPSLRAFVAPGCCGLTRFREVPLVIDSDPRGPYADDMAVHMTPELEKRLNAFDTSSRAPWSSRYSNGT